MKEAHTRRLANDDSARTLVRGSGTCVLFSMLSVHDRSRRICLVHDLDWDSPLPSAAEARPVSGSRCFVVLHPERRFASGAVWNEKLFASNK